MPHFINARSELVADAVDGLIVASEGRLARLDGYPDIRVVLRADWRQQGVALVSGGGSGHEPAHAGLVGNGLLTAAVCGDIFASPSTDAVLAAILAVTGEAGCLVIIKNYAGDRLNFGLAAERARALGRKVETVIVADDIAITGASQPRGIAGTLFVHKVAGCTAAAGRPLIEVAEAARSAMAATRSIGLAVSTCNLPGLPASARLKDGEAELGLGIHGEAGVETIPLPAARDVAALLMDRLSQSLPAPASRLALLVNNLGATTALEMQIVTRALLDTPLGRNVQLLLGPAAAMTALDMHGLSVSALVLDDNIEQALRAETDAAGWPRAKAIAPIPAVVALPDGLAEPAAAPTGGHDTFVAGQIAKVCDTLIAAEAALNALDSKVGDGDTGTTFATAARTILKDIDVLPTDDPAALCQALSRRLSRTAGGSGGVLLSIFFAAAGTALAQGTGWAAAVARGNESISVHGGAQRGDRTMLDASIPAAEALIEGLAAAAKAAQTGADATARMARADTGRSSYLGAASLEGTPDPGAVAVAKAFAALVG